MKNILTVALFITCRVFYSQDTTVVWIKNIDTTTYKIFYKKKEIPKEFYRVLNIKDIKKLANPKDKYSPGCINPIRGQFHWMAIQKKKWIICVTYGGKGVYTKFFFLDKDKGILNINELNFPEPLKSNTTFGQVVTIIKAGQYAFEEFDPEQYKEDE